MVASYSSDWLSSLGNALKQTPTAECLRAAAITGNLREWTRLLTAVVVSSCEVLGWRAAARGHKLNVLPQSGQEYLGIDVMAFASDTTATWPFPLAAFELENQGERAAYSLWKVICVQAELRVVFAYRKDWDHVQELVQSLKREVVDGYSIVQRQSLGDEILLVTGSRGEGETFPNGFFKIWRLNSNTGSFERLANWG